MSKETRKDEPVYSITSAKSGASDDILSREVRYGVSMGIRTVCFVGAVIADGWLRWVLVVAAFILPYVAVIMANTASPRVEGADLMGAQQQHKELGP